MNDVLMMNEDVIKTLLEIPGAKRAARGVIVEGPDGSVQHIRSVIDRREAEGLTPDEEPLLEYCSRSEVLRLREIRGAHDYLLRLRASALAKGARAIRVMLARRDAYEQGGRQWSLTQYYHTHDHFHKSYLEHLPRAQAKALRNIPTGLAPIKEANAVCIGSLAGDVVVAAEALVHFYYFMSLAYYGETLSIPLIDRADALLIALRIMKGSEALDFDLDPRGALPESVDRVVRRMVADQMRFTYGHEYAHALLGHTSQSVQAVGTDNAEIRAFSHEAEFAADLQALRNIEHNRAAFEATAVGGVAVLHYLSLLEELAPLLGGGVGSISGTHPPARERMLRLHGSVAKRLGSRAGTREDMLGFVGTMKRLVERRLEGQRPDLLQFYGSAYLSSFVEKRRRDRYDY